MLRARKILTYVMDRLDSDLLAEHASQAPSDWLELLCLDKVINWSVKTLSGANNKVIPPKSTLAMIRLHIWRNSGDIVLYYRLKNA